MSTEIAAEQEDGPPEWAVQLRDEVASDPRVNAAARRNVTRDMPSASDEDWQQFKDDIAAVLTVYDEHVAPENRGPWRDRLVEFIEFDG